MTIEAGRVISGRYRLLEPVGRGAQASVWVAEHLALGTQVAVKLIDQELAKQDEARERFRREATAAAKLRSAHVVQILDHGIDGDQPFIVMELLEGEDLFQRIDRKDRLTIDETSKIITQVARALARAHAAGIVHRDLKPENVFLVPNEDEEIAKVLDFGVAKVSDPAKQKMARTGVGTLIGTPHYMSPEQVQGIGEVDHRADLWAVGVIAYQCITGELPFDSEGVGDLLVKITLGDSPVPSQEAKGVPPAFDLWFAKACAREPAKRFQSARELAIALAKAVGEGNRPLKPPKPLGAVATKSLKPPPPRPSSPSRAPAAPVELSNEDLVDAGWGAGGDEAIDASSVDDGWDSLEADADVDVADLSSRPPPADELPPDSKPTGGPRPAAGAKPASAAEPTDAAAADAGAADAGAADAADAAADAGAADAGAADAGAADAGAADVAAPPSSLAPSPEPASKTPSPLRLSPERTSAARPPATAAAAAAPPDPSPSAPRAVRAPKSTPSVGGLSSSGSSMPPPELDPSRRRRGLRVAAGAFVALAGVIAWQVVSSQMVAPTTDEPATPAARPAAPEPSPPPAAATPAADDPAAPASAAASASAGPDEQALNPGEATKPLPSTLKKAPPPAAPHAPHPGIKKPPKSDIDEEFVIEVPLPEQEAPAQ